LKNIANLHLLGADGRYLPFKNEAFLLVTSRLAPHSIKEAYRTLKKNGLLLLVEPKIAENCRDSKGYFVIYNNGVSNEPFWESQGQTLRDRKNC